VRTYLISCGLILLGAAVLGATVHISNNGTEFTTGAVDVGTTGFTTFSDEYTWQPDPGYGESGLVVMQVYNAGPGDLTAFKIQLLDCSDCEWYDYLSGTDFDTATSAMLFSTIMGPHEVTSNGYAHVHFKARGRAFRFAATSDGIGAKVTVKGRVGKP
jgi:hypothetical protein